MSKRKDLTTRLEENEAAFRRWQSRLTRAANKLRKLDQEHRRLLREMKRPLPADKPDRVRQEDVQAAPQPVNVDAPKLHEDLSIPEFLRRGLAAQVAVDDEVAKARIRAEIDDKKKRKTAGRIAKLKAQQSGETRKMPLAGKAALAKIMSG